jgi:hypothetical protein
MVNRNPDIAGMTHTRPVTFHQSCKDGKKQRQLCPSCLHWDPRPEEGAGPGVGYCAKRDVVTRIRCECDVFEEATPMKVEARNRSIYGTIPEAEEGEE